MRPQDLHDRLAAGYEYDPMYGALCNERDQLKSENAELRDEIKQLKLRDITLSLMMKLMHFAISYMQERTDEVAVFDGIRLTAGYFERRMAALGIEVEH